MRALSIATAVLLTAPPELAALAAQQAETPHGEITPSPSSAIQAPPRAEVERLTLSAFYTQHLDAGGLPIVASAKVSPFALLEARYLIDKMLDGRDDIRARLVANKVRYAIMAVDEMTTAIPEHSDLKPARYWDRRARGLGATHARPAVSCGEENLLRYPGDPYVQESLLLHEFAHAIHLMALVDLDPTFDNRLREAFEAAVKDGLWQSKYAGTNKNEYWAEGVQSWFDDNRLPDHDHNHVNTREELKRYDPRLAKLVAEVFGDKKWRYKKPTERSAPERTHLQGYDPANAKRFAWPAGLEARYREYMKKKGRLR
ncbi:MAG: hypothetical protein AB8H80_10765 [Planctomycetota bacterium]